MKQAAMALVVVWLTAFAHGQSGDPVVERLKAMTLEELLETEIRIPTLVGASRYEQTSVEAPASVSVVTRDDIRKYGYRTIIEALRSLRGFTFLNDRALYLLGARGFNDPSDINSRVLVMVDGHRTNDSFYDTGILGTEFPVDIDLVERIEVVRGPISALYGSNAFLALVNIITRDGHDVGKGELSTSYGSFDTIKGRLTLGHQFRNGPEFLISGSFFDTQGPDEIYFPEYDAPETNNGIAEHDGDKATRVFGKLSFLDFTLGATWFSRETDDPTGQFTVFNDPLVDNRGRRWTLDLKYEHTFGEDCEVAARISYDKEEYEWIGQWAYTVDSSDPNM